MVVSSSSSKSITPPESVIDPFASVRLPMTEPVAAVSVPAVLMFPLAAVIVILTVESDALCSTKISPLDVTPVV